MRIQPGTWRNTLRGMTLIEVVVTISLLSFVMASALTLYSNIMKTSRQRDSLATLIADSDRILSTIERDIQNADHLLSEYPIQDSLSVVAALPMHQKYGAASTVVYALDNERPNHLLRIVYSGNDVASIDMSAVVQNLTMTSTTSALVNVELTVEDTVAGNVNTWQVSSAFALTH